MICEEPPELKTYYCQNSNSGSQAKDSERAFILDFKYKAAAIWHCCIPYSQNSTRGA